MSRASSTTRRAAISGDVVKVSGETVVVASGAYLASGIYVAGVAAGQVSGAVIVSGFVSIYSGQVAISSGEVHVVSGQLIAKVSGETVVVASGAYLASGIYVVTAVETNISGQPVFVHSGEIHVVSGQVVAKVSGEVIDIKVPTSVTSGGIFIVSAQSGGVILTSGPCISATVKSMSKNSADVFLSGNPMQSGEGFVLEPGEAINLDIDNFGRVKLLAVVSGDRVTFVGVA